jgi:isochorismate synthase
VRTPLKELQQYCLSNRIPFVSYALPGEKIPVSLFPDEAEIKAYKNISDINCTSGFILSPFQSENCPVIVIPDTRKKTGWEIEPEELLNSAHTSFKKSSYIRNEVETSFLKYSNQIDRIKKSLAAGEAKKVVLSRVKVVEGMSDSQLPNMFEELVNLYPGAFVYLVYTPASEIWLGATPESLLQMDTKNFSTMALAGTQEFFGDIENIYWTEKELKEHEYVAAYVRQKLSDGGYHYQEQSRKAVKAGNVVHLQTMFEGDTGSSKTAWKDLVTLLYPTPAICGTENEATLQMIRLTEEHKREYYSGIIGPFNSENKTHLFINLRCMKVLDNTAVLYAGGGILNESSAQMEWDETEMKFNTLIRVMQNVKEKTK